MAMTLRLDPEHERALTLLAEAYGTTKHTAALRAILSEATRTLMDAHIAELAARHIPEVRAQQARMREEQVQLRRTRVMGRGRGRA